MKEEGINRSDKAIRNEKTNVNTTRVHEIKQPSKSTNATEIRGLRPAVHAINHGILTVLALGILTGTF